MSTLWTPGGERPIRREGEQAPPRDDPRSGPGAGGGGGAGGSGGAGGGGGPELSEDEIRERLAEMRDELARTPVSVVVANHAFGLFELAALHLSLEEPQLEQARLAIDALSALVDGVGSRLGEHSQELSAGLAQLRMAYVKIQSAHDARGDADTPGAG
jgi:hypothetical protein